MNIKSVFTGIGGVVTVLALGVLLGSTVFSHKPGAVIRPPAVVIHDTVTQTQFTHDTVTLTKTIIAQHVDTIWLSKITVTKPETVTVVPELYGLTALKVGVFAGDTTYAVGFHVKPDSTAYTMNGWEQQWITPGPLHGFLVYGNGSLRVAFDAKGFPQACTFWDDRKHELYGAAGITLLRALLGK